MSEQATTGTFTIAVGDRFQSVMEGSDRVATYEVDSVAANGAVMAHNVRTGKLRQFSGYGRMLPRS